MVIYGNVTFVVSVMADMRRGCGNIKSSDHGNVRILVNYNSAQNQKIYR